MSARGALGGAARARGEGGVGQAGESLGAPEGPSGGAPGAQLGEGAEAGAAGVLERLEARLGRLAALSNQQAQVLRAIAEDLPVVLEVLGRTSPDRGVETTSATSPIEAPAREQMLDVNALAELLSVKPKTVRSWREQGVLPPAVVIGGVVRWRRETIDAWLATREETSR